jgi:hypothetical protein
MLLHSVHQGATIFLRGQVRASLLEPACALTSHGRLLWLESAVHAEN